MRIGEKYFMCSNLQRPVYIAVPGDIEVQIAERPDKGFRAYQRSTVLRSMLLSPAQRDVELDKRRKQSEWSKRKKREMREAGYNQ